MHKRSPRHGTRRRAGAFGPEVTNRRMEREMKALLAALTALLTLSACETVEGFGRDVETTGEVITQESQEAQMGM